MNLAHCERLSGRIPCLGEVAENRDCIIHMKFRALLLGDEKVSGRVTHTVCDDGLLHVSNDAIKEPHKLDAL